MTIHSVGKNTSHSAPGTKGLPNDGCFPNSDLKRYMARAFVIAGGGMGAVTLAAFFPAGYVAIPCALAAIGVTWYSTRPGACVNPVELEKARKKANLMSLKEVTKAYGWEDVLRFGILTPEVFAAKYKEKIQGKSLVGIIDTYEKIQRHISSCPSLKYDVRVPHPGESALLWRRETASLTFEEIIKKYPLDKLEKYGIPGPGERNCIQKLKGEYEAIKKRHDQRVWREEPQGGHLRSLNASFQSSANDFNGRYRAHLSIAGVDR